MGEDENRNSTRQPVARDWSRTRRDMIQLAGTAIGSASLSGIGSASERYEWVGEDLRDQRLPPDVEPKIDMIVRPLHSAPTFLTRIETLSVELDLEQITDPSDITASLRPSFGNVRTPVLLQEPIERVEKAESELWPNKTVIRLEFEIPEDGIVEGLYDLRVEFNIDGIRRVDSQRRAVNIVEQHTDSPQVVVIADPSVGDPRQLLEGAEGAQNGNVEKLIKKIDGTVGISDDQALSTTPFAWAAMEQTLDEINLVNPDFVLVTGDLTFGAHPRPVPYEYEDAYQLFDRLEVPTFYTPGNHDLYEFDGYIYEGPPQGRDDLSKLDVSPEKLSVLQSELEADEEDPHVVNGQKMWKSYFGPMHYSINIGSNIRLISINTFDWEDKTLGRTPAGGQVRARQLQWIREELNTYRAENPEGEVVTFAHHDPSWIDSTHAWPGKNKLELRDLLAEYNTGAHFSGHTHEDRVARYHVGNIVQTHGRQHKDQPLTKLSYMRRDDSIDESWTQTQLGQILHDPQWGPLFVSTTTAASGLEGYYWGLGGYWGWRLADLSPEPNGGYDPEGFGYPASEEFLSNHAMRPENWNAGHSEYGVFAYPSSHLESENVEGNNGVSSNAAVKVSSELAADIEVTVRLSLPDNGGQPTASAGNLMRVRRDGQSMDVWIQRTIPANSVRLMAARTSGMLKE